MALDRGTDIAQAPTGDSENWYNEIMADQPAGPPQVAPPGRPDTDASAVTSAQPRSGEVVVAAPGVPQDLARSASGASDPDCQWRTDPRLSSQRARAWQSSWEQRRNLGIEVDANGCYTVAFGDDLTTIARRNLAASGQPTGKTAINREIAEIIALNKDRYPSLDCNKHLIREGWKLALPRHGEAPPAPQPPVPPRVERPAPAQPPEVIPGPEAPLRRQSGNINIGRAGEVVIINGQSSPRAMDYPRPQGEPYYEEPAYIKQPRGPVFVEPAADYGYDYGYQPQPVFVEPGFDRPRMVIRIGGGNDGFGRFPHHSGWGRQYGSGFPFGARGHHRGPGFSISLRF